MGIDSSLTTKFKNSKLTMQKMGLYRERKVGDEGDKLVNFCSNDYLSISSEECIKQAYKDGFDKYPTGSMGSMVICGYHSAHKELEEYFAKILQVDECLLFPSGYAANLSVVSLLAAQNANILIDKSVHASIYDGIKLSNINYKRFQHNDLLSLNAKLSSLGKDRVVITEGIFSMSGQVAPLADIAKLTRMAQADLIVDEAHAFGVFGLNGLGTVASAGLSQNEVPLRIIPLGKAIGASGAIVAGQKIWIENLLQMRPAIYSTAISPAFAYGLLKTVEYIRQAEDRRLKLANLIAYFKKLTKISSLKWRDSVTQIQQLQLGCPHMAVKVANKLLESSIVCSPIRQPTVTKAETGLRIILNYKHEFEDIDLLFNCLHKS